MGLNGDLDKSVALLTNFIPPYRLPLFESLAERVKELRVFVSTSMERGTPRPPEWGRLSVQAQRGVLLPKVWQHPHGFSERSQVHVPYDTLWHLARYRPDAVISDEL